jgi:hypothetical protein
VASRTIDLPDRRSEHFCHSDWSKLPASQSLRTLYRLETNGFGQVARFLHSKYETVRILQEREVFMERAT